MRSPKNFRKPEQPKRTSRTDQLVFQSLGFWGLEGASLQFLHDSESLVYEVLGRNCIARLTRDTHRTRSQIEAELQFILACRAGGVDVAAPLRPEFLTLEQDEVTYHLVLFEKAPGWMLDRLNHPEDFHLGFLTEWGRSLGRIHRVSYSLRRDLDRPHWRDEPYIGNWKEYLSPADQWMSPAFEWAIDRFTRIRPGETDFGLIHSDLHMGNLFWTGSRVVAFDFDDSHYSYYAYDLAVLKYYAFRRNSPLPSLLSEEECWPLMWEAYCEEYPLDRQWYRELDQLVFIRGLFMLSWASWRFAGSELSPQVREWKLRLSAEIKEFIASRFY